jgi:uncharacterized coiled-coil DUF342 family protein
MAGAEPTDVTASLAELERRLVELERELEEVTATPSDPPTPPRPDAPAPAVRVDDLREQIADLARFRDELEAAARRLLEEYDRLVRRLQASADG